MLLYSSPVVFLSDDYWVFSKLKKNATRLEVINIGDLSEIETIAALRANHQTCKLADAKSWCLTLPH